MSCRLIEKRKAKAHNEMKFRAVKIEIEKIKINRTQERKMHIKIKIII